MRVQLMLTCLCDAFYGEVGIATTRVLEAWGYEVEFPEEQTCCGQPALNAGDWSSARSMAEHTRGVFDGPIVTPSASCAATMRHGYELLGLAPAPVYELAEFLAGRPMPRLGPVRRRVAFHRSCHGRMIGLGDTQERVLASIPGIEIVRIAQADQCCGFGGAFSATHGHIADGIGDEKLRCLLEAGVEEVLSGDMGCLMHLAGLASRRGLTMRFRHYAEILAEALDG